MIAPNEVLSRFILTRSHLDWSNPDYPRLRPEALMPHPHVELSVFRTSALSMETVKNLGESVAAERSETDKRQVVLQGCGEIENSHVLAAGLNTIPAEPPPNHACIIGWPKLSANKKEDKSRQKSIAQRLISETRFVNLLSNSGD